LKGKNGLTGLDGEEGPKVRRIRGRKLNQKRDKKMRVPKKQNGSGKGRRQNSSLFSKVGAQGVEKR